MQRLERALREAAKRSDQGRQDAQRSRELREQAQKLMEQMSPEQRDRLAQAARDAMRDRARPDPSGQSSGSQDEPRTPGEARPGSSAGDGPGSRLAAEPTARPLPEAGATADARGEGGGLTDRPLGEWMGGPRGPEDGGVSRQAAGGIRQAAAGAQRAIEQQQVPAEYSDLVRRVFDRYVKRASPPPADPPGR
jgi:hypothetical protein